MFISKKKQAKAIKILDYDKDLDLIMNHLEIYDFVYGFKLIKYVGT